MKLTRVKSPDASERDPRVLPALQALPEGYAVVCSRCGLRNGRHYQRCTTLTGDRARFPSRY